MTTPAPEPTPPKKKRPPTRLKPREVRQAIELWELGEVTLEDLEKKFGKHKDTFQRLFKRVGAEKGSRKKEIEDKAKAQAHAELSVDAAETAKRIKETRDEHYKMHRTVASLVWHEMKKATEESRSIGTSEKTIKTLKMAAEALEITRRGRFSILGLDRDPDGDTEVDDLEVRELTDEQIREMAEKAAAEVADEDNLEILPTDLTLTPDDDDDDGDEIANGTPAP